MPSEPQIPGGVYGETPMEHDRKVFKAGMDCAMQFLSSRNISWPEWRGLRTESFRTSLKRRIRAARDKV